MWSHPCILQYTASTPAKIIFEQLISFGSSRKSSGVVGVRIALLKLTSRLLSDFYRVDPKDRSSE